MSLACVLALAGCRTSQSASEPPGEARQEGIGGAGAAADSARGEARQEMPRAVPPDPETRQVLMRAEGYRAWPRFPSEGEAILSEGHGGVYVVTYQNEVVTQAMQQGTFPLPDGALFVKENRMRPQGRPAALTLMSKQGGEWYWVKATPAGQVFLGEDGSRMAGRNLEGCQQCHAARQDNDYIFTHDFRGAGR